MENRKFYDDAIEKDVIIKSSEIAKDLLASDGSIFIQVDWHQAHYLKILLDDILKIQIF